MTRWWQFWKQSERTVDTDQSCALESASEELRKKSAELEYEVRRRRTMVYFGETDAAS